MRKTSNAEKIRKIEKEMAILIDASVRCSESELRKYIKKAQALGRKRRKLETEGNSLWTR